MNHFRKTSIRMLRLCLGVGLFCLTVTQGRLLAQSRPPAKPSLDILVRRANTYWSLLERGNKTQAIEYVAPSSRGSFIERRLPAFSAPHLVRVELSGKPEDVRVVVALKRFVAGMGDVDWQVSERWIFSRGSWFVLPSDASTSPLPTEIAGRSGAKDSLSPVEIERRQKEIREALRFDSQSFDFGTVKRGAKVEFEVKYSLSSPEPLDMRLMELPDDMDVAEQFDPKLKPGKEQGLRMQFLTQNHDGEYHESFVLQVSSRQVTVPFRFDVRGTIYSPVSAPARIFFLRDQKEQGLVVRNNSKSEVKIVAVSPEHSSKFLVSPIPVVIPPGGQATLSIRTPDGIEQTNYRELLSLSLERPVEDFRTVKVLVILNYVNQERGPMGLTDKQLNDLLRNPQPPPIKP